ncbi:NF-kappa-B inhibitor zeta-like [Seriola lalandi dorsalis]|uniref:Zgc:113279 n=1 Tax=Seriola lalandi dorsalis TaxID=1841481 RepID=A0A3B4WFW6_SERLL|nr:NF-kappa-B inhibitor zeta-like [Seriola lalandi dorsalis]XP_056229194.1 NF-kappa-B inhibitor zeta [Seriola aureovittata]XP_056229195.1 NF-kappa-B inhibitor zeta [Seriola aureovittata]
MRGRYKRRDPKGRSDETTDGAGLSPLPGQTAAGSAEPDAPPPGCRVQDLSGGGGGKKGAHCSLYGGDKVYLGVRVKMPVRDLLRNVRLARGWEPQDSQETCSKRVKGDKKRVKTRSGCRTTKIKCPTKSLEELAIIVEVLEEDLRTGNTYRSSSQTLSSFDPPVSPEWSPTGYNSEESDEMIPSPRSYMSYSPGTAEYYKAPSPPVFMHAGLQPPGAASVGRDDRRGEEWFDPMNHDWSLNSSAFFWTQLQKEESQLRDVSDAVLLATDEHGRTALHKVACVGKRALGYAIAKRMAALNSLDRKDSDGMTALLHAANHNHHLMVADLIRLGANVNETNNSGKSCLHLSAEKGYIRVLEVLKHTMTDGVYVDVEATDNCGMSVLQCASVALKATVCELENSKSPDHTRLHTLRQEQMMETLECLLHMGSYLHTMGSRSLRPTVV